MENIVYLSNQAKEQLAQKCAYNGKRYILLSAKGGGCAGFKYDWEYIDEEKIGKNDSLIPLNATQLTHTTSECYLVIDSVSEFALMGMNIEWKEEISGSYIELVNPNAKNSCGCGESFSV
jgi:iron-sulfur cluster insertion protein|tara:strand:+ start:1838 stop:2197 length:360 start_codon:yes stop_codon:yes gene_type:complete